MIVISTQCFPPRLGGIETLMGGLALTARAAGHDVAVYADSDQAAESWDGADGANLVISRFGGVKPVRRWLKARAVLAHLRGGSARLIVDSWKSLEPIDGARLKATGARVVCLAHGMEFPAAPKKRKRARILAALAKADLVLANSRYTLSQAEPYLNAMTDRGVATPPISSQPSVDPAIAGSLAARIGAATPLVATLCRLEPRKGVDRLIEAVADLSARHPGLRLAVAGGGPDRPRLETLAASLGVSDRIIFLGRVSEAEKAALYDQVDVFAMPARREGDSVEGYGIVYLEAGWYGTPSLAGADGGAVDAVLDGETGLLCEGADPIAVRAAMERMISDPASRAAMGEAAARHARANLWSARIGDFVD